MTLSPPNGAEVAMRVDAQRERQLVWLLLGLVVLAAVIRFWRLGDWSFQATEMFTLRDSNTPQWRNPRPLGYLLNYYLVRPFLPLDEFGLRLLPALFGVLAVPAFYLIARRVVDHRAALFGALLLTVSPLLLMYSQLARYWSLVFLLCTIYPCALYLGIRNRDPKALSLGVASGILAALAHPVSVLVIGGPLLWMLVTYLRPSRLRQLWSHKSFRWGVVAALLVIVVIAIRFIPILENWISSHDKNVGRGQFLLRAPPAPGLKQIFYLAAFVESLTVPVVLGAVVGVYLLWRERDRTLAIFLASLAIFPLAFITLLSLRTAISQYYLLPATPVFFLGAGVFLDRLVGMDWNVRPRWLIPATLVAIFVAAGAPTLISDLRDGRRYDFKGVAGWLQPQLSAADAVFSDQPMVMAYYLPEHTVQMLREPAPLEQTLRQLERGSGGGNLWIVAPAASHAFRTNLRRGGLANWLFTHCQLQHSRGVGRVDLRQQYLHVYRCPPLPAQRNGNGPRPASF
jgi:4-amino-4-deoxy-L-arabinose transferase-like glycosyltransferase